MSYAERHSISITTDADGAATSYTPAVTGAVSHIRYVKTDFADTVDFTITSEATGQTIWAQENVTASATVAPRQPTHDSTGTASLYASTGEPVEDRIVLANDRVKIVIASGGDTKTGTFHVVIA